jgi:hypothetical protein
MKSRAVAVIAAIIIMVTIVPAWQAPAHALTLSRPYLLAQAESAAVALSSAVQKDYSQVLLKQVKYSGSIKSTQAKIKDKRTLRWSPLLSFKLPQSLNYTDELEMRMKPITLTAEITTLRHKMNDDKLAALSKVRNAYSDVYLLQEKVAFTERRLATANGDFARNSARLAIGNATQADVDTLAKQVSKLEGDLSQQMRNFETAKSKLGDIVKLDLSRGYRFINPFNQSTLTRDKLESIIQFTLANDQGYYETKTAESLALQNLNTTETLMRNHYGGKMDRLGGFLSVARSGGSVDQAAFQMQYDEMLKDVDSRWQGYRRILFFKFSKELFKGDIDGIRYVQDDPYALLTFAMEYNQALKDSKAAEKELRDRVASDFESIVTAKNAADALSKTVSDTETSLNRLRFLNGTGKAEFSEVQAMSQDYEDFQSDYLEALGIYNQLITDFDRLTCGGVRKYLDSAAVDLKTGGGALSFPTEDGQVWYYLYQDTGTGDITFSFGLDIPDDFEPAITHYELVYEGTSITNGAKEADTVFRHLLLDYGDSNTLTVRLSGDSGFIADCEIDCGTARGPLPIENENGVTAEPGDEIVGSYKIITGNTGLIRTAKIEIIFLSAAEADSYRIRLGDVYIGSGEPVPADKAFDWLGLITTDLTQLRVEALDSGGQTLFSARLEPGNAQLIKVVNEE